jgi:hypothetical protein
MSDQPKKRGFALLSREKHRAIASLGGRMAHTSGRAHQFTSEEARAAGIRGGNARHVSRGTQKKSS